MGHHHITEIKEERYQFTNRGRMFAAALLVVGLILAAIGAVQVKNHWNDHSGAAHAESSEASHDTHADATSSSAHGTDAVIDNHASENNHGSHSKPWTVRLWANILLNAYYFVLFAVGGLFFVALKYAANAGWSTMIKRIPEAMSAYLPVGFLLLFVALYLGKSEIYHWYSYMYGAEPGSGDHLLDSKSWFLNKKFFLIGIPVIGLIWILFRIVLRRLSLAEDQAAAGDNSYFLKSIRFSAAFIFIFAFSFSILSWLVMMSIDAHWFSTIFSVYNFAIAFVTTVTIIALFAVYLKRLGYMEMVSDEVMHDLGKFMFAFSIFWTYIWLAQYLLIWYANLPEETVYYDARLHGYFRPYFFINIAMNFALPFLILMMRNAKRSPYVLVLAGSIILVGHWIDLFLMVMPGSVGPEHAGIGLLEIGTTMAFAGLFIYIVSNALGKASLYPKNHPYLLESANYDVGV